MNLFCIITSTILFLFWTGYKNMVLWSYFTPVQRRWEVAVSIIMFISLVVQWPVVFGYAMIIDGVRIFVAPEVWFDSGHSQPGTPPILGLINQQLDAAYPHKNLLVRWVKNSHSMMPLLAYVSTNLMVGEAMMLINDAVRLSSL